MNSSKEENSSMNDPNLSVVPRKRGRPRKMPDFTTSQAARSKSVTITSKRLKEGESHSHNQQPIFNNNGFEPKLSVMFGNNEGISAQVIAVSPLNLMESRELQTSEDSYQGVWNI